MTIQEKVRLAAAHCLRSNDCSVCEACPYNEGTDYGCRARLRDDIIALLKAQEPCEDAVSRKMALEVIEAVNSLTWSQSGKVLCGKIFSQIKDLPSVLPKSMPRVMTTTEAYTADCVYIEFGGVITPAIRTSNERNGHRESYFATQQLGGDWMRWDDYGKTWRCWTRKPTEDQMEETPWDD